MKISKTNWKKYSEHKIAVMPSQVSDHILTQEAPVFRVSALTIPVMVIDEHGAEVRALFPADYPTVGLRGVPMVRYNVDYDIMEDGELYPGTPETRATVASTRQRGLTTANVERKNYELLSKSWAGYVLDDMDDEVKQTAREMPEFDNIVRRKHILEMWNLAMRASTGQRDDHVVNDVLSLFDLVPADGVTNARAFIEDYITVYNRIQGRMMDPAELLELVFSSRFIGAVRDHVVLGPYALLSNRERVKKTTIELRTEWLFLLGRDEIAIKKNDGAVSANVAKQDVVSAHMATIDTSILCGDCCAHANIATVKKPGRRVSTPAPSTANHVVRLCFNCMGADHLVKECKAKPSFCPVKGCGERHHEEAHKFIVNRRQKRKMHMGKSN